MPHIHTEPGQHDLTASAYVFRIDGPEPRILLHWHKKLNSWMQFGGHVELHESPWATVVHELREESGYDLSQLKLLQPPHTFVDFGDSSIAHPLPFILGTHPFDGKTDHFHTNADFLFTTETKANHAIAEDESSVVRLFTREEITQLPKDKILQNVKSAATYAFGLLKQWRSVDPLDYSQASPKLDR